MTETTEERSEDGSFRPIVPGLVDVEVPQDKTIRVAVGRPLLRLGVAAVAVLVARLVTLSPQIPLVIFGIAAGVILGLGILWINKLWRKSVYANVTTIVSGDSNAAVPDLVRRVFGKRGRPGSSSILGSTGAGASGVRSRRNHDPELSTQVCHGHRPDHGRLRAASAGRS